MAENSNSEKKPKGKSAGGGTGDLVKRIALYGVLGVVVVVLLLVRQDRVAQSNRNATLSAVADALDGADDLKKSKLADLVVGSPTIGDVEEGSSNVEAFSHQVYTWSGPFSSFSATVHFDNADDPNVVEFKPNDD